MIPELKKIHELLKSEMQEFRAVHKASLKSSVGLIDTVIAYISRSKGKQLRPILTMLSAKLCGSPNDNTFRAASLFEILHVATLLHDDVVDEADLRRGFPTVARVWKNKIAILVGDFMFSKALTNMIHLKNWDALETLSGTARRLSEGEISQMEKARKKEMSEEQYFKMVADKTASLIHAACKVGALTVDAPPEQVQALANFGEKLGIAFQIKDDLFDVMGKTSEVGKPVAFDIKRNMLTLPLIFMLQNKKSGEKRRILNQLQKNAKRGELKEIRQIVEKSGGLHFAQQKMEQISMEAERELDIFPASPEKDALIGILNFNIGRKL